MIKHHIKAWKTVLLDTLAFTMILAVVYAFWLITPAQYRLPAGVQSYASFELNIMAVQVGRVSYIKTAKKNSRAKICDIYPVDPYDGMQDYNDIETNRG